MSYDGKINKNFHHNKIRRECPHCYCKSLIVNDSVLKKEKNYY